MLTTKELLTFINNKLIKDGDIKVTEGSMLFKDRFLDSITILSLIGYIEEKLNKKLSEDDMMLTKFESINSIIKTFANNENTG